jgi:uncharacterized protein involved in exopolysaccharide biosynthesis
MHAPLASSLSLRDIYRVAFRHKKKFLAFFALAMTATTLATLLARKTYLSEGKLFVRLGRENVGLDATTTLGEAPAVAIPFSREAEMNSTVELLHSRVLAERVVDALGPETILGPGYDTPLSFILAQFSLGQGPDAPSAEGRAFDKPPRLTARDKAILKFEKRRGVGAAKASNVIYVSYEARHPALAQAVLAQFIEEYLKEHARVHRTPGTRQFLTEQTKRLRRELAAKEEQLRALKERTGIASPAERRTILVARVGRLEDELLQAEATLAATLAEARRLRASMRGVAHLPMIGRATGLQNSAADSVRQQLYDLQLMERELSSKYTPEHPEVAQVRRQIAGVQALVNRQTEAEEEAPKGENADAAPDAPEEFLAREPLLASIQVKTDRLRAQLTEARAELRQLNDDNLKIARLEREVALREASYRKYVESLEQATIDQSLRDERITNVNVAEPATYAPKPVRPDTLLNLALGFGLALTGGAALVLLSEYLDHSLKTPEDVESRLGVPALAVIPRMSRKQLILNGKN